MRRPQGRIELRTRRGIPRVHTADCHSLDYRHNHSLDDSLRGSGRLPGFDVLFLFLCTFVLAAASCASSIEVHGSGTLPLSDYVHNGVRLSEDVMESGDVQLTSRLVDQRNSFGGGGGLTGVFGAVEVSFLFQSFGWSSEFTRCVGDSRTPPTVLPSGSVDDTTVRYDCSESAQSERALSGSDQEPMVLNIFTVGYRIPLPALSETIDPFIVIAGGLGFNSFNGDAFVEATVAGLHLDVGGGMIFRLVDWFSLALETRYNLFLTGPLQGTQAAANRAAASGRATVTALFDAFHYLTLTGGLVFNFE